MTTLYGNKDHFQTQKVLTAAQFSSTKVTVKDQAPPAGCCTFSTTPALSDGKTCVAGGDACSWHVGGASLRGQVPEHQSQLICWMQAAENKFLPSVLNWVLPSLSLMQHDKKAVEAAKSELLELLSLLNDFLLTRTFLVGERLSLADLSLAFDLIPAFQHVLESDVRDKYSNVTRWFLTVVNQPQAKAVIGELQLCEKTPHFDGKKFKEYQSQAGGSEKAAPQKEEPSTADTSLPSETSGKHSKKKSKKDKKKEKEEKKPKEKPAKKEAEEEMDEAEEALAKEPKAKDPFAEMPKGAFNMDEFKRTYSNEDTEAKAIPYFWEHFEKENYSIWYCEYKYPDELTLMFMSCNLVSGMMQRLDKLRKNAFGSMCLFGTDRKTTISGLWFWRGHELVFPLSPDWQIDYDSYSWKKLDADSEETKKLVHDYFTWEGFDGKEFNQGKIFK